MPFIIVQFGSGPGVVGPIEFLVRAEPPGMGIIEGVAVVLELLYEALIGMDLLKIGGTIFLFALTKE